MKSEDWLAGLLHDEQFMTFIRQALEYKDVQTLLECKPEGMSDTLAWELACFQRKASAYSYGSVQRTGDSFYCITPHMSNEYRELTLRLSLKSSLWKRLAPLAASNRYFRPYLEDVHTALFRDGMDIGYERLRELLTNPKTPARDDIEVIARNAYRLITHIDLLPYGSEPDCTKTIQRLLLEGTADPDGCPLAADGYDPIRFTLDAYKSMPVYICPPFLPGETVGTLFDIVMNSEYIFVRRPFERYNALLELLIRAVAAKTAGLPAFSAVPLSTIRYEWEQGVTRRSKLEYKHGEAIIHTPFGTDCTPFFIQMMHMLLNALEDIEEETRALMEYADHVKEGIDANRMLTLRQKQLVCELIDAPTETIDVAAYAQKFDTALSTARAELKRLVDMRLCKTHFEGKKQLFELDASLFER